MLIDLDLVILASEVRSYELEGDVAATFKRCY